MIAIGCDHGGFVLKQEIIKFLESAGYEYEDLEHTAKKAVTIPYMQKKLPTLWLTESAKRE